MPTRVTVPAVLFVVVLAAGCGSGGAGGAQPTVTPHGMSGMSEMPGMSGTASASAPASAGGSGGGTGQAGGGVPDACTLVAPAELGSLLGQELSAGTTRSASPDRSACMYPGGVITAVEVANHYQASRTVIDEQGRTTQDVPGIGTAAFYDPAGQVVARGDTVFVAVTAFGVPRVRLAAAAAVLLAAAE